MKFHCVDISVSFTTMPLSHQEACKIISRFAVIVQDRIYYFRNGGERGDICGNLVTQYGKRVRCRGDITSVNGCYNCNNTGYYCKGCGDSIKKGANFCNTTCSGIYYAY
jgi:hypothetical protein